MNPIYKYLTFCLFLFLSTTSCAIENNIGKDIASLVETFCFNEFRNNYHENDDRDMLIKYSAKMERELRDRFKGPEYPYVWYINSDPIFIVSSYKVISVKQLDDKHAYAIINYHQLVKSEGWSDNPEDHIVRRLVKDVRNIQVKLDLENDGKRWWIIDPPYPKVSYDVVLKFYQDRLKDRGRYWFAEIKVNGSHITESEKKSGKIIYDHEKSILDFLISLKMMQK